MWNLDPQSRPSIGQIMDHPWVSKKIDTRQTFLEEMGEYQLIFEESTKSQTVPEQDAQMGNELNLRSKSGAVSAQFTVTQNTEPLTYT